MDCERPGCGHPLSLHDPCSAKDCGCSAYEPADRKARAALITDVMPEAPLIREARVQDERNIVAAQLRHGKQG